MQRRCITLETYHLRDFVVSHAAKIISTRIQMSMQLFMYGQVFEKSKTWCLNQTFWKTKAVPTSCKQDHMSDDTIVSVRWLIF